MSSGGEQRAKAPCTPARPPSQISQCRARRVRAGERVRAEPRRPSLLLSTSSNIRTLPTTQQQQRRGHDIAIRKECFLSFFFVRGRLLLDGRPFLHLRLRHAVVASTSSSTGTDPRGLLPSRFARRSHSLLDHLWYVTRSSDACFFAAGFFFTLRRSTPRWAYFALVPLCCRPSSESHQRQLARDYSLSLLHILQLQRSGCTA